jgi:hypothetical protein
MQAKRNISGLCMSMIKFEDTNKSILEQSNSLEMMTQDFGPDITVSTL